jgi:iron complex transport system substrate-binding protein
MMEFRLKLNKFHAHSDGLSQKKDSGRKMFVKNFTYLLAFLILLTACVSAVNTQSAAVTPYVNKRPGVLTDAAGISVNLPEYPQRIVIEGKQTQMIADFFYLFPDQSSKIVGMQKKMQTADNFLLVIDPAVTNKLNLEENASAEQVAPLKPDLVILKTSMKDSLSGGLAAINIPIVYMDFENPGQFTREITNLGIVLNQKQRATEINSHFGKWERQVTTKVADLPDDKKPKALVMQYSDKNGLVAFSVPSSNFLQTATIEMAGGIAIWKNDVKGSGWNTVGLEQIAAWNPDMIFVINYFGNSKETVGKIYMDSNWKQIRAVRNNNLYGFPGDFISWDQPDPRWVLGLNWLGNKMHPDLISFDTNLLINKFYSEFYKIDAATVKEKIIPLLKGNLQ